LTLSWWAPAPADRGGGHRCEYGRRTLLLDQQEGVGGTGGFSGLTTICGLYDDQGRHLNDGFARTFAEAIAETEQ